MALQAAGARFLIVGAYAMAIHGVPRFTVDLDVLVRPDPENARRVWQALLDFGAPAEALGLSIEDLSRPDLIFQMGQAPRRIDLITEISGIDFDEAWGTRRIETFEGLELPFLGREALILNKRASGRPKDLLDLDLLAPGGRAAKDE
jgi:hypothetical protein